MPTLEEINTAMETHGDAWCEACHGAARQHIPNDFNPAEDYPKAYWEAYQVKWDELCPDFDPLTGKGYPKP